MTKNIKVFGAGSIGNHLTNAAVSLGYNVVVVDIDKLALDIKLVLKKSINLTKNNKKIIVNLAINYGSKNEILNTLKKIKKSRAVGTSFRLGITG